MEEEYKLFCACSRVDMMKTMNPWNLVSVFTYLEINMPKNLLTNSGNTTDDESYRNRNTNYKWLIKIDYICLTKTEYFQTK